MARLNEVLKEINAQIEVRLATPSTKRKIQTSVSVNDQRALPSQKSDAFREDLAFTCQVWKGYENRVQSHCEIAADATSGAPSNPR